MKHTKAVRFPAEKRANASVHQQTTVVCSKSASSQNSADIYQCSFASSLFFFSSRTRCIAGHLAFHFFDPRVNHLRQNKTNFIEFAAL
jgi:hypothetical protein